MLDPLFLWGGGATGLIALFFGAQVLLQPDALTRRLQALERRRTELRRDLVTRPSRIKRPKPSNFIKQVVEKLKLAQGTSVEEARKKLLQAGFRNRETLPSFLFAKLAIPAVIFFNLFVVLVMLGLTKLTAVQGLLVTIFFSIIGFFMPDIWLKNAIQSRSAKLLKQFPDALDLLVICAEAGLSLDSAFDRVARELGGGAPELAEEIGLTGVEIGFFPDRHAALRGLAERVALPGMLGLVNTLIQTERYGTPLAQALRVLSAEMREERMMRAEEKAARLPAIMTVPMIAFILPPLFVVLIGPAVLQAMDVFRGMKSGDQAEMRPAKDEN